VDTLLWIVVTVLVLGALLAGFVLVLRRAARPGVDPTDLSLEPDFVAELRSLAERGKRVEAIARLRQRTGVGLADAVRIVERLAPPPGAAPGGARAQDGQERQDEQDRGHG
jgi:ribosomal protein L7/L12